MKYCKHSYGLRVNMARTGEVQVFNLIIKGTPLPALTSTKDLFGGISMGTGSGFVDEVDFHVLENDSYDSRVDLESCREIFEDAPIKLDEPVSAQASVAFMLYVEENGKLSMCLEDLGTGMRHHLFPVPLNGKNKKSLN